MAEIALNNRECREGGLPDACAACGKRKTQPKKLKVSDFTNNADGTATLRFREIWLPLCAAHRAKMRRAIVISITALILMLAAFIGSMVLMATKTLPVAVGFGVAIGGVVVGIAVMMTAGKGQVRARRVSGKGVRLVNVSASFVKAVEQQRASVDTEEEDPDPPRKKKRPARD